MQCRGDQAPSAHDPARHGFPVVPSEGPVSAVPRKACVSRQLTQSVAGTAFISASPPPPPVGAYRKIAEFLWPMLLVLLQTVIRENK
jgi:hypothetical protein